jgi:hypothetical protein
MNRNKMRMLLSMAGLKHAARRERRRAENLYVSILVDVGVTYRSTMGKEVASDFFDTHGVPKAVAGRVLADTTGRRQTENERRLQDAPQAKLPDTPDNASALPIWLRDVRRRP